MGKREIEKTDKTIILLLPPPPQFPSDVYSAYNSRPRRRTLLILFTTYTGLFCFFFGYHIFCGRREETKRTRATTQRQLLLFPGNDNFLFLSLFFFFSPGRKEDLEACLFKHLRRFRLLVSYNDAIHTNTHQQLERGRKPQDDHPLLCLSTF